MSLSILIFTGVLIVIAWILIIILWLRNHKVYKYCITLGNEVNRLAKLDIDGGYAGLWRFRGLDQGNYNEMVLKFWRPLDSFYPDKSFLNPEIKIVPELSRQTS